MIVANITVTMGSDFVDNEKILAAAIKDVASLIRHGQDAGHGHASIHELVYSFDVDYMLDPGIYMDSHQNEVTVDHRGLVISVDSPADGGGVDDDLELPVSSSEWEGQHGPMRRADGTPV